MKIVMTSMGVPPYLSGGVTSTINLAQALSRQHKVTLIAGDPKRKNLHRIINPSLDYFLLPGIVVRKNLTVAYPYPKKVENILTAIKPDVLHLNDISPLSLSIINLAKKLNIPTVITHHFTAEFIFKALIRSQPISNRLSQNPTTRQLIYDLVKLIYNHCNLVVVPNFGLIPYFKQAKLKPPIIAVNNGIRITDFRRRALKTKVLKRFGIKQKQLILWVGRLDQDKSLPLLIEAFSAVATLNPDTGLVLIGSGHLEKKLKHQVRKLGLNQNVYFLGSIDNQSPQLSHLYNAGTIFASPSIIENQSVSFIEAMAAGLPIVATDIPLQNDFIIHGKNGLLVPPHQPAAFAVAMDRLLNHKTLRQRISQNNRRRAQDFDITKTSQGYIRAYQKALRLQRRA